MKTGRIIKAISNQYTIADDQGNEVVATPRGRMRLKGKPLVGDIADYEEADGSYRLDDVHPRRNELLRPQVANVDQALIVTSAKDPDFSEHLLNRLIFLVCLCGIDPVIVITKSDLLSAQEKEELDQVLEWYKQAGYPLIYSHKGSDDSNLCQILNGKVSVLCGQSGAGKSSLLNRLDPSFELKTGETSKALGRGKHTTRHCELHPIAGGLTADTPGFSSLDFSNFDVSDLDQRIPDFKQFMPFDCRFKDCRHINEPDCAVKKALAEGKLSPAVYEDYKQIVEEAQNRKKY